MKGEPLNTMGNSTQGYTPNIKPKLEPGVEQGEGDASGSDESMHSNSPLAPIIPDHPPVLPQMYVDSSSYPGSGPAQYASKALDMNSQNAGPYYKNTYPSPTDSRHQSMSTISYPGPSSATTDISGSSYHTMSAPTTMYDPSARSSLHHSPTMYHTPDQHTGQLPPFGHLHQHLQFVDHHIEPTCHYPTNALEWARSQHTS